MYIKVMRNNTTNIIILNKLQRSYNSDKIYEYFRLRRE